MLNNLVDCKKCLDFLSNDVELLKIKVENMSSKFNENKKGKRKFIFDSILGRKK